MCLESYGSDLIVSRSEFDMLYPRAGYVLADDIWLPTGPVLTYNSVDWTMRSVGTSCTMISVTQNYATTSRHPLRYLTRMRQAGPLPNHTKLTYTLCRI